MFVDRLTQEQRQALFDLAVMTAAIDNDISEEELQYLKDYSEAYSVPYDLDKSGLAVVDLLGVMDSKLAKVITLQELIKISYKDGHFGPEEQDKVFSIAQKMGLNNPELILSIERWVRQGFDWIHEGEQLLH
ncbi:TerB family tellurite resistance protein [Thiomicrospira sp.]|uniref:TerB family tellurite resistance protein n=1 Tax=Thiomicrospira sp. TaxID=935 RepID=UPI002F944229